MGTVGTVPQKIDKTVNIKNDWLRFWKGKAGACIMIHLKFDDNDNDNSNSNCKL